MRRILHSVFGYKIWKDECGQDMVEYAMIVGFLAVASGMLMPNISEDISTIFSKISSGLTAASATS
jgi:Flp pilus assembly pilin Flp